MSNYPKPRLLLCVLGTDLPSLIEAARGFHGKAGFEVDEQFSSDEADDRMIDSFGVCWDTVAKGAYDDTDETAVEEHDAVMYVISPHLEQAATVPAAAELVQLAVHLLDHGAAAVKCESAGVAHGVKRWRVLAKELAAARGDVAKLARVARLAVTKRPLGGDDYYESLGNHLVGLPEVYVPHQAVRTDRDAVKLMDEVADELAASGVDAVVAKRGATLDMKSQYEGGFVFKINPYGVVKLRRATLRPSVAGA